ASLRARRAVALGGPVRGELAAPGARVRLLLLLSHAVRRALARVVRPAAADEEDDGSAAGRVAGRGTRPRAGAAGLSHHPEHVRLPAEPGRHRELQHRHRGTLVRGPGFAAVAGAGPRARARGAVVVCAGAAEPALCRRRWR